MPANNEFTFTLSVSEQSFTSKPPKNGSWGKELRFKPQQLTVSTLLDYAKQGKVFCPVCRSHRSDGSYGVPFKEDFLNSQVLFFDIDDSDKPMAEYIDVLTYKPTFAYTTFSNRIEGYRYRLGYVFKHPIRGEAEFNSLYQAVSTANGFTHLDKRGCVQIYFGTSPIASTYYPSYCPYIYTHFDFDQYRPQTTTITTGCGINNNVSFKIDDGFLNDFRSLSTDEFLKKYSYYYQAYKDSLESSLILDKSEMFYTYPDPYYAVIHKKRGGKTTKWSIGDNRKKKIFFTAKIMLKNLPSLTFENLLFNLRLERDWYYINHDGKVNNDMLIRAAKNAYIYDYPLNSCKHGSFRVNKPYWQEQGINAYQASNHIKGYLHALQVEPFYNPYISYEKNVEIMKEKGIKISETTLKRMVTDGSIRINNQISPPLYLSEWTNDVTIRVTNAILNLLRENGSRTQTEISEILNLDKRTIKRYFKKMQGDTIRREGNNRTGKWVVVEPEPQQSNVSKVEEPLKMAKIS